MRWIPEGDRTASLVAVADADGGNAREIARLLQARLLAHPRWSPDGRTLAISGGAQQAGEPQSILLMDADGRNARTLKPYREVGFVSAVAWLNPREILYSQAESVVGDSAGSSANFIRQDIRGGPGRPVFWSPHSCLLLDLAGPSRIVFDARSPRQNLRELDLDGSGPVRWLSRGSGTDRQPVFTPDGAWVAFSSNRSGNLDLWAISTVDGSVRHLTDDEAEDWDPGFSPDGRHLLWSSNRTGPFEIWIANADGSGARQLSRDGADAENPTATRDGRWVVYKSGHPTGRGLWKIRFDGTGATRLVEGNIGLPEVSPDGRFALYRVSPGPRSFAIRVVEIEGGAVLPFQIDIEVVKVTPATLGRARWTPDGRAIVFTAQDAQGVNGLFLQAFAPEGAPRAWKPLGAFDAERITESFGISPDGNRVVVAGWEQMFSLMSAEEVPGLGR
jgi:dipeptidyl aminopeptidase/acylaminoacyl peptidase